MYGMVRVKNKCICRFRYSLNAVVATYIVRYNAYNDELSMVLYSLDQMQGIKLTHSFPLLKVFIFSAKCVCFQR